MELVSNWKLAFKLNVTHVHCSEFNAMLVFMSAQTRVVVCNPYGAWTPTPRYVGYLVRHKLAFCSLVGCRIWNETGVQHWSCRFEYTIAWTWSKQEWRWKPIDRFSKQEIRSKKPERESWNCFTSTKQEAKDKKQSASIKIGVMIGHWLSRNGN